MRWIDYLVLAFLGLAILLAVTTFQAGPGYMDAEYYYLGGVRLAGGHGFSEMIVWNYLDDPTGLPHPSHGYWMPLASLLAFLGIKAFGTMEFTTGRAGFILVAACLPPLTAALAYRLAPRRRVAWLAGLLAVFPVFYLPFLPTSDTFGLYMLLGICWLWLAAGYPPGRLEGRAYLALSSFLLGAVSGLMHLARADGILWLALALGSLWLWHSDAAIPLAGITPGDRSAARRKIIVARLGLCLLGYLMIISPWLARNLAVFGSPLAPGGVKALWFVDYDDLYIYPSNLLTPARWWASGLAEIIRVRLWAFGQNLQTFLAVQGDIILIPLMLWGLWRFRRQRIVRLGALAWGLTLAVMTIPFPFAGAWGGFFHSASAVQPLFWSLVPFGLEGFITWASKRRKWHDAQAWRVFSAAVILLVVALSVFIVCQRVVGADWRQPIWSESQRIYILLGDELAALGADSQEIVLVNNPPGFHLATGWAAIAIPDGDLTSLLSAARQFGAGYLILEANHPAGLDSLYQQPASQPGLHYISSVEGAHFFEIQVE
jgi:hypothetical protein